jgi:preprotein translocase subunit SecY
MDEVITKWGIGSGISLFIAAGVSQSLFQGTFSLQHAGASRGIGGGYNPFNNPPVGTIPMVIYMFASRDALTMVGTPANPGGFESMFLGGGTFPNPVIAFVGTVLVFLFVVFAESSRIELPLAHGKVRGARGRYPLRLVYASNIPVILMAALLANVNIVTQLLWNHEAFRHIPIIGHAWWVGGFDSGGTQPVMGGAWYLQQFRGVTDWLLPLIDDRWAAQAAGHNAWQILLRIVIFLTMYIGGSIMFARFWVETTNMGPRDVAKQIEQSGMQIPGFRRDPRILEKILERYIPTLTIIGGATVGGLAAFADMIGTVGNASGTGLLLCVGIYMRMYEQIAKEQAMEMHPMLRSFFGAE